MKLLKWICVVLWLASATAQAKTEEVVQQASGFGDTPAAAVANALVEASRQALGVSVLSDPSFRVATYEWVANENMATGAWTTRSEAQATSLSNVAGYRVIDTRKVGEGLWQADIEARLLRDVSIGPDRSALPSLVVAPFRTARDSYDPGQPASAADVRAALKRELVNAFVQSGRVRGLDRDFGAAAGKEMDVTAESLSPFEQAKRGQALGADLVMAGEVESLQLGRKSGTFYGTQLNTMEPVVRIHYRLIDTATREIIAAGTWDESRSAATLRQQLRDADIDKDREPERITEVLYPNIARGLVNVALESLYPLRILSAPSAESVFVSQGDGALAEGDLLSVHRSGGEMADPDTGITIRMEGPAVATLRVTNVASQFATAELVTGELASLDAQAILHVRAQAGNDNVGPGKPATPGSSEAPVQW